MFSIFGILCARSAIFDLSPHFLALYMHAACSCWRFSMLALVLLLHIGVAIGALQDVVIAVPNGTTILQHGQIDPAFNWYQQLDPYTISVNDPFTFQWSASTHTNYSIFIGLGEPDSLSYSFQQRTGVLTPQGEEFAVDLDCLEVSKPQERVLIHFQFDDQPQLYSLYFVKQCTGCQNNCSAPNGQCVKDVCICEDGYFGSDCSVGMCFITTNCFSYWVCRFVCSTDCVCTTTFRAWVASARGNCNTTVSTSVPSRTPHITHTHTRTTPHTHHCTPHIHSLTLSVLSVCFSFLSALLLLPLLACSDWIGYWPSSVPLSGYDFVTNYCYSYRMFFYTAGTEDSDYQNAGSHPNPEAT